MTQSIRIIEIVGPPGAGKSTLARAIHKLNSQIRIETFPYYRRIRDIPFFIKNFVQSVPLLLRLRIDRQVGWLSPRDLVSMIIISGWHKDLKKTATRKNIDVIMDEGAVVILAWLQSKGSKYMKSYIMARWWDAMYQNWAETIDLLVYLDIPVPEMLERIRVRDNKWEKVTDVTAQNLLESLRESQEYVGQMLKQKNYNLKILRFTETENSVDAIGNEILRTLDTLEDNANAWETISPI